MTSELKELVGLLFVELIRIQSYVESKLYEEAMNAANEALKLCDQAPPDSDGLVNAAEGSIAAFAGMAARCAGQLKLSLGYAEREWATAEKSGSASVRVRALNNRGLVYHELNNLVAAETDYKMALNIIEENNQAGLDAIKAQVLSHLGQLLNTQGRKEEAIELLSQAGSIDRSINPFWEMSDSEWSRENDLATIALSLGKHEEAETIWRQLIARSAGENAQIRGIFLCNLAQTLHGMGQNEEAIELYRQAIELHLGDPGSVVELATDYVNLAQVYMGLGKREQVTDCYKRAWDVLRKTNPRSLVALKALWGLSMARMVQRDFVRGRATVARGLDLYEQLRPEVAVTESGHEGFLAAYRSLLEMGMYLALQESWPDELKALIERGKARYALERLAQRSEKATFKNEELEEIAGINGLVLNYFVGPNALFIAYQYNRNLGGVRVDIGETDLGNLVNEFREELLSSSRLAREGVAARRLSKILFEKLKINFTKIRYIYHLPDGPLWYVPFETLPWPPQVDSNEPMLLGTVAPASYAPSASVLSALRRNEVEPPQRNEWHMVAFGEPQNDSPFPALLGTGKELNHLEQLADGRFRITVKRGVQATKENFIALAPSATHIHISAHAVADFGSEQPYIVFSGYGEDQFLCSGELAELKLKAQVVFLSACSTSVGKRSTGEGVMSLARAFLWCGCRSVVASLWPMPDSSAPIVVNLFYSGLISGLSTAQAAQLAREESRLKGVSVSAWAGFQVLGDGDTWEERYSLKYLKEFEL